MIEAHETVRLLRLGLRSERCFEDMGALEVDGILAVSEYVKG